MKEQTNLNGTWDFVADLDPKYHAIHGGFHNPDVNRRHWQKVPVPGVWQKYGERYDIFEGVCWFAREFEAPETVVGATASLRFGAVNYLATVYLNGDKVGSHEGGYTEFVLDVTGKLKAGQNLLAVQVDNRATTIKWPPCLGYFNYGGIHRDVSLEIAESPILTDLCLDAAPARNDWELTVSARIESFDSLDSLEGLIARISSDGLSWEELIGPGGTLAARLPFPNTPGWSPENPNLVMITVELLDKSRAVLDRRECQFGFRTLAMRDGRIHLNGQPYPLKGVCYVYDSESTGLVMTKEQIETDLCLMKEAGCNAVRCHYPMDESFYAACDRLGLLVWIEPPVYCYHPGDQEIGTRFTDPEWLALAQQMAIEMIAVARNHPSVAIYSIGNECNTDNPEAEAFFRSLAATMREKDPTRLISYAALYGIIGPIADIVDVLGINSYWGWYDKIWGGKGLEPEDSEQWAAARGQRTVQKESINLAPMQKMIDEVLVKKRNLALLLTEFGADSVPGSYSASRDLWSENYHADLLREILALAKDYPQIVGTFPFCFSDYRDPSKVHNGYWNELNLKGLVDYRRNKKLAHAAVGAAYREAAHGTVPVAAFAAGMTKPERILATLNHQPVDRCAVLEQLSYNPRVIADWTGKAIQGFDYTVDDICAVIRQTCDLVMPPVAPRGTDRVTTPDGFVIQNDNWTVWHVSRPFTDAEGARDWLLARTRAIRESPFDESRTREDYRCTMLDLQSKIGGTVILNYSWTGFCRPFDSMGLEIFTFFQLDYPEVLKDYMEASVDAELRRVHAVADSALSPVILIPEDFATKQGPIFGPEFLHEYHYPYIRLVADAWHEHGVKALYHSDGNWKKVIPDLIACQVDGFYCLEPNCGMDIVELKNAWPEMGWAGGVDGVDLMERGTPEQVKAEVRRHIRETRALETGGMFVASSSEINPPIPPENFRAMVEAVREER